MFHEGKPVHDSGIMLFVLAIILLPTLHSLMHILPLFVLNKRIKLICIRKKALPILTFYTDSHVSKYASILSAITPTITITIPGIIMALLFPSLYVYLLIATAINIAMTVIDFLYIRHLIRAPRNAYIENGDDGFDILLKAN
jgi:Putative zincin peptidase